ncbi:MAG: ferrous iron transport protein A [Ilumatobacter sp.]|uniref:FeoA family protein n=1 Tax=Ilumatobacter sp. TaxID=1967498 RepID=UPI00262E7797|nr:ferrous iron transport protein A [Ilumatobacter sp.]MDJ0767471.1 ferrous iron transport protein A [Ilumatobacter sp.]
MRARRRRPPAASTTLDGRRTGSVLRVVGIDGGRERRQRLMGLGVRVGAEITISHTRGRSVVVASDAGRVAVGPELARHIHVEEVA